VDNNSYTAAISQLGQSFLALNLVVAMNNQDTAARESMSASVGWLSRRRASPGKPWLIHVDPSWPRGAGKGWSGTREAVMPNVIATSMIAKLRKITWLDVGFFWGGLTSNIFTGDFKLIYN
jgi:hypothetical protein